MLRYTMNPPLRLELVSQNKTKPYIVDPLSVIIKLAIISHKPVGVKISIADNILYIQDAGIFQPIVRYYFNYNKGDLHYLYNPIELACQHFLVVNDDTEIPANIVHLFLCALRGIQRLKETYKDVSVIVLCLNYYANLISNYLGDNYNEELFKKDMMTCHYTDELVEKLNERWTIEKIKLVLEMTEFLFTNDGTVDGVRCLEEFMKKMDEDTRLLIRET